MNFNVLVLLAVGNLRNKTVPYLKEIWFVIDLNILSPPTQLSKGLVGQIHVGFYGITIVLTSYGVLLLSEKKFKLCLYRTYLT